MAWTTGGSVRKATAATARNIAFSRTRFSGPRPDQEFNGCSPLNRWDPGTDASEPFVLLRRLVSGQPLFDALSSLVGS